MKKTHLLLAMAIMFCLTNSYSQTKKGTIVLGTSSSGISFGSNSTYNFNLSPDVGYFLTDNLLLGLNAPIDFYSSPAYKSSAIGINPYMKYYFLHSKKMSLFATANAGMSKYNVRYIGYYGRDTQGSSVYGTTEKDWLNRYNYGLGIGANYFITKNVSLESSMVYNRYSYDNPFSSSWGNLDFNVGIKVFLNQ